MKSTGTVDGDDILKSTVKAATVTDCTTGACCHAIVSR